jgi:ATP-dependent DNA helicase RecG
LFHLPRRYDDLREMTDLGDLVWAEDGTVVSARVRVADIRVEPTFRRRVQRTVARLEDDTGWIEATWFGRRYIERRLRPGDRVVVSGKVKHFGRKLTLDNPEFQADAAGADLLHVGRIVPVYRLTAGLTAQRLRLAVRDALDRAGGRYPEYLPTELCREEGLVGIGPALEEAHFPSSFDGRDRALDRLAFDELLALQIGMVGRRRQRGRAVGRPIAIDDAIDHRLRGAIRGALTRRLERDVDLTPDQAGAMTAIRSDLAGETPMLRLLQGDVGSGKTAVAAFGLAATALAGRQAAILAPTDLLARQHAATLTTLLEDVALPVEFLAGSLRADRRRAVEEAIENGQASIVVGTHALLSGSTRFRDLALVVVDEQHRFGVDQRAALEAKAGDGPSPHVLLMTATPIPRTLGQVLYADLDVSDLRTAPEGRRAVRTAVRRTDGLGNVLDFAVTEAEGGRATFVVVPAIEESDDTGAVAAEAEAQRIGSLYPMLRVGLVHGRMKASDRDAEVGRLRDGELDLLVGTTVLEVGVDVPRATLMVVESADRFGLAQLHQLRGRVGRGDDQAYCALVSDVEDGTVAMERLKAVESTTDGFDLAEADFALRGEGDVLGLAQSGLPGLRVASLQRQEHRELAARARRHAERILDAEGSIGPGHADLARELAGGWLTSIYAAEPASGA